MAELISWTISLFLVFGLPSIIEKNKTSHKNMSNSQIDREIDKYLK